MAEEILANRMHMPLRRSLVRNVGRVLQTCRSFGASGDRGAFRTRGAGTACRVRCALGPGVRRCRSCSLNRRLHAGAPPASGSATLFDRLETGSAAGMFPDHQGV